MALSRLTSIDTFRSRVIRDGSSRTRPPVPEINRHVCELYVRVSSRRLGRVRQFGEELLAQLGAGQHAGAIW
jgi:hypothetical protein